MDAKKDKPKSLSDQHIKDLAGKLIGTTKNVYREAESMFGIKVEEEVFDRLAEIAEVAKCSECNEWKSLSEWSDDEDVEGPCESCLEEMES